MKKYIQSKTIKVSVAATLAILISNSFGIMYSATTGIIAILSITDTKREAAISSSKRFIACIIAIFLSYILYRSLGNNALIFGIFLIIFIPLTKKFDLAEGLVTGAVLSTHLLISNNINMYWIFNEIMIVLIGIGVAFLFNLFTESYEEEFDKYKEKIEEHYRILLSEIAVSLVTKTMPIYYGKLYSDTEDFIDKANFMAMKISNKNIFKNDTYYSDYMEMRILQLDNIKRMNKHFLKLSNTYEQTIILSEFIFEISNEVTENNDCIELLDRLEYLREEYAKKELPRDREEFEDRAMLFQFLTDIEEFLIIKRDFIINNRRLNRKY